MTWGAGWQDDPSSIFTHPEFSQYGEVTSDDISIHTFTANSSVTNTAGTVAPTLSPASGDVSVTEPPIRTPAHAGGADSGTMPVALTAVEEDDDGDNAGLFAGALVWLVTGVGIVFLLVCFGMAWYYQYREILHERAKKSGWQPLGVASPSAKITSPDSKGKSQQPEQSASSSTLSKDAELNAWASVINRHELKSENTSPAVVKIGPLEA
eukprot:gene20520-24596_t